MLIVPRVVMLGEGFDVARLVVRRRFLLSSPARKLVSVVPVGLLLAAPVLAHARPVDATAHAAATKARVKLNSISTPPRTAAPGQKFTVTGTVTNTSRVTRKPAVQISVRRTKGSFPTEIGRVTLRKIKPGHSLKYKVKVKIPLKLAAGKYY